MQEVFRVQLPGDIMLGEGKPENQNHAMIFTRGEALQTIDMNQCGYFEEALKMRNLLCEFRNHPGALPPTILGFREHIFTGGNPKPNPDPDPKPKPHPHPPPCAQL